MRTEQSRRAIENTKIEVVTFVKRTKENDDSIEILRKKTDISFVDHVINRMEVRREVF
jgi:hypothetical protein